MASLYQRLMKRRRKLNNPTYTPLVYSKGKKVEFTPESANEYKLQQIKRIDKRLGVRNPKRRPIRTIRGLELQTAVKDLQTSKRTKMVDTSTGNLIGVQMDSASLDLNTKAGTLSGNVTFLYVPGKNKKKGYLVKGSEISGDLTKKKVKYKRQDTRSLLTAYMSDY
tara:strand:+ start:1882 stop:2379 length:498 start_codon:yes stop_codon:yes gene_type:complete